MTTSFTFVAIATAAVLCCAYADSDTAKGLCKLTKKQSVEYRCLADGTSARTCKDSEPSGTVVQPNCAVGYYSPGVLPYMRCIDGSWDYIADCVAECGIVPPNAEDLQGSASTEALPWHAIVYSKTTVPYRELCGATLITKNTVISAAHCFWDSSNNKQNPVKNYAIAVGKMHRAWDAKEDQFAQKSDVADIKIPSRFQGMFTNFQEDIAMVILATEISFGKYVRPVCLNFDVVLERRQLQANALGKTAAWRSTGLLKVLEMTFIPIDECISSSPPSFREYITADKICVRSKNGTSLCKGDGGSGISFPEVERGSARYYLRGVASVKLNDNNECNTETSMVLLTQITRHEHFIKEFFIK